MLPGAGGLATDGGLTGPGEPGAARGGDVVAAALGPAGLVGFFSDESPIATASTKYLCMYCIGSSQLITKEGETEFQNVGRLNEHAATI